MADAQAAVEPLIGQLKMAEFEVLPWPTFMKPWSPSLANSRR